MILEILDVRTPIGLKQLLKSKAWVIRTGNWQAGWDQVLSLYDDMFGMLSGGEELRCYYGQGSALRSSRPKHLRRESEDGGLRGLISPS